MRVRSGRCARPCVGGPCAGSCPGAVFLSVQGIPCVCLAPLRHAKRRCPRHASGAAGGGDLAASGVPLAGKTGAPGGALSDAARQHRRRAGATFGGSCTGPRSGTDDRCSSRTGPRPGTCRRFGSGPCARPHADTTSAGPGCATAQCYHDGRPQRCASSRPEHSVAGLRLRPGGFGRHRDHGATSGRLRRPGGPTPGHHGHHGIGRRAQILQCLAKRQPACGYGSIGILSLPALLA